MLTGTVVDEFENREESIVIRYPVMADAEDLMELLNSLVDEGAKIGRQEKTDLDGEVGWIGEQLVDIEKGKMVALVLEVEGKVVGNARVTLCRQEHMADFDISVREGFRGRGLGERLMDAVMEEAVARLGIEILKLKVYADNEPAISLYEKKGFEVAGRISDAVKHHGDYVDEVIMVRKV